MNEIELSIIARFGIEVLNNLNIPISKEIALDALEKSFRTICKEYELDLPEGVYFD